jgi:hypothetical protein
VQVVGFQAEMSHGLQIHFAMKTYQNGQDFVTRLNLLLDNELTPDAEREMLEEIKSNPEYREMLAKEQSFREFVRSRVHRKTVSPSLILSIKEKIHSTSNSRSI